MTTPTASSGALIYFSDETNFHYFVIDQLYSLKSILGTAWINVAWDRLKFKQTPLGNLQKSESEVCVHGLSYYKVFLATFIDNDIGVVQPKIFTLISFQKWQTSHI